MSKRPKLEEIWGKEMGLTSGFVHDYDNQL